jgi:hypothetical protein
VGLLAEERIAFLDPRQVETCVDAVGVLFLQRFVVLFARQRIGEWVGAQCDGQPAERVFQGGQAFGTEGAQPRSDRDELDFVEGPLDGILRPDGMAGLIAGDLQLPDPLGDLLRKLLQALIGAPAVPGSDVVQPVMREISDLPHVADQTVFEDPAAGIGFAEVFGAAEITERLEGIAHVIDRRNLDHVGNEASD